MAHIQSTKKHNYTATQVPVETNDETEGYSVGSHWYFPDDRKTFMCFGADEGSAVWKLIFSNGLISNKTGDLIPKIAVVKQSTPQGGFPTIVLADKSEEGTSHADIRIVLEDIADNGKGFAVKFGNVYNANTTGTPYGETWLAEDELYLGDDGQPTNVLPASPDHTVRLGYVVTVNANIGIVAVHVETGYETYELHDVGGGLPSSNDFLLNDGTIYNPTNFDTEVSANDDVAANTAHVADVTTNPHNVTKSQVGLGNVDNTSDATKLEDHQDNLGGTTGGDGFLQAGDEHLDISYNDAGDVLTLTVHPSVCYFPAGIELGNTDQEYDISDTEWNDAVAGGTLGGIPDETIDDHHLADCLAAVTTALDATYLSVREGTGAASATNPATVHFLFEDITAFDTLDLRVMYSGSVSHIVGVEFWNYTTSAWVRIDTIASSSEYLKLSEKVFGSTNFIGTGGDEGNVILQIIHDNFGIATHRYEFDLVSICSGGGGGGAAPTVTEFTDNTFRIIDEIDNTKEIAFQASGITTGNIRTVTMPDADVDLSDVNTLTYAIKAIADDTVLVPGDGLAQFTLPNAFDGMDLIDVEVKVYTPSSSGLPSFQFYNLTKTQDMLSTNLTVDANETDSSTADDAAVIDTGADDVSARDVIRIDCDNEGTGTAGAEFEFVFIKP